MATLISPLLSIPAVVALGLDLDEAVENDEFAPVVYLLDSAGAGFGYRYEWEGFGPFSDELTSDLAHMTDEDFVEAERLELSEGLQGAVEKVKPLVTPPRALRLSRPEWLWLLVAVHFLERRSGLDLGNGKNPPFVTAHFDQQAINAAKERIGDLP